MPLRPSQVPPEHHLDFESIREELDNLVESFKNKLEREWPDRKGTDDSAYIVWSQYRLAQVTFKAIRYLAAEKPADYNRKPEFVLAVPPLLRSIVDALANVVYLFSNLSQRTGQFLQGGWREDYEHFERDKVRLAGDPDATTFLEQLGARVDQVRAAVGIDPSTPASKIPYWPILSRMIRDGTLSHERLAFLKFLDTRFYRDLSSGTHFSGPGVHLRTHLLFRPQHKLTADDLEEFAGHRSAVYMVAMALMFCLMSELEIELRFGLSERMIRLWTRVNSYWPDFKSIYDQWYASRLPQQLDGG